MYVLCENKTILYMELVEDCWLLVKISLFEHFKHADDSVSQFVYKHVRNVRIDRRMFLSNFMMSDIKLGVKFVKCSSTATG